MFFSMDSTFQRLTAPGLPGSRAPGLWRLREDACRVCWQRQEAEAKKPQHAELHFTSVLRVLGVRV